MEQVNLFDIFGVSYESEKRETKKEVKKAEKKNAKKDTKKDTKKASSGDQTYKLPVKIYTSICDPIEITCEDVDNSTSLTLKEIKEYFCNLHKQFEVDKLYACVKEQAVFIGMARSRMLNKGSFMIKHANAFLGEEHIDLSSIMTESECEVDVEEISKCVHEQCSYIDAVSVVQGNNCTLLMPANRGVIPSNFPVNVYFNGREMICITEEDYRAFLIEAGSIEEDADEEVVIEEGVLKDIIKNTYLDMTEYVELQYSQEGDVIATLNVVEKPSASKGGVSTKKYPVVGVTLSFIFNRIPISPEDFGGKEEVEESELLEFIQVIYPEYKKNCTAFVYDKETKYIMVVYKGSTKGIGIDVVTSKNEYSKRIQSGAYELFHYVSNNTLYRVESTPASLTVACDGMGSESHYDLRLPKIPGKVYDYLVALFSEVATKYRTEFLATIYYDMQKEKYIVVIPRQNNTGSVVNAYYDLACMVGLIPIADFHSHCHYNAFFSEVDNADEQGNKIFGVFGSFGSEKMTEKYRAGTGGKYVSIHKQDIFTFEKANIEEMESFVEEVLSNFEDGMYTSIEV